MRSRLLVLLCGCVSLACTAIAVAQDAESVPVAAQTAMAEGQKFEARKQLTSAADSYRAAVKAGGKCVPCFQALARVQAAMDDFKDAAGSYTQAAALEVDAIAKSKDEVAAGRVLWTGYFSLRDGLGAQGKDAKKASGSLSAANAVLERAVADDPANEQARMLRGRVLAALKKDEDASREFAACAAVPGTSPEECARALRFSRNVAMAREQAAPAFTATSIHGKPVTLESLAGKVVLIDFWATWCQYCERDSDYVQSMMDSFDKDKFVLLEVSVDENEDLWRSYVKDKRLEGVQTRDAAKDVATAFHVTGYPTYIVLDGEGSIRMRAVGAEEDMKKEIRTLLAEAAPVPEGPRRPCRRVGSKVARQCGSPLRYASVAMQCCV